MTVTRYAVYFTPAQDHPLTAAAEHWLGRSAWRNEDVVRVTPPNTGPDVIERFTRSARKYGFHATMKAPFRLVEGQNEATLLQACEDFASAQAETTINHLIAKQKSTFSALVPAEQSDDLWALAASAVEHFEPFRAPLSGAEMERRLASPLTDRQKELLTRWGYPYVMEEFRFHLTLSGRLPAADLAHWSAVVEQNLPSLDTPFLIDQIALCGERSDGRFELIQRYALTG